MAGHLDGPACEHPDGCHMWYHYGKMHRIDGPATYNVNPKRPFNPRYFVNGVEYFSELEYAIAAQEWLTRTHKLLY